MVNGMIFCLINFSVVLNDEINDPIFEQPKLIRKVLDPISLRTQQFTLANTQFEVRVNRVVLRSQDRKAIRPYPKQTATMIIILFNAKLYNSLELTKSCCC